MTDTSWKIWYGLVVCGAVFLFLNYTITTGYWLGCLAAWLSYRITEHFADQAVTLQNPAGSGASFLKKYILWAAVLSLCAWQGKYLNVFACAVGLVTIKLAIIIDSMHNN